MYLLYSIDWPTLLKQNLHYSVHSTIFQLFNSRSHMVQLQTLDLKLLLQYQMFRLQLVSLNLKKLSVDRQKSSLYKFIISQMFGEFHMLLNIFICLLLLLLSAVVAVSPVLVLLVPMPATVPPFDISRFCRRSDTVFIA